MWPWKGFNPFPPIVCRKLLDSERPNWYILAPSVCAMSPVQYFKNSKMVETFPEEFAIDHSVELSLADGKL